VAQVFKCWTPLLLPTVRALQGTQSRDPDQAEITSFLHPPPDPDGRPLLILCQLSSTSTIFHCHHVMPQYINVLINSWCKNVFYVLIHGTFFMLFKKTPEKMAYTYYKTTNQK